MHHDYSPDHAHATPRRKYDEVRVIPDDRLAFNTEQAPGMFQQTAINHARVGAEKIWVRTADKDKPVYSKFVAAFDNDKIRRLINSHFDGAMIPAF